MVVKVPPATVTAQGVGSIAAMIWLSWLAVIFFLGLLSPWTAGSQWVGEVAVLAHAAVAMVLLGGLADRRVAFLLIASLGLRVALVFWDLNFGHIFVLPNSGADSEMFYRLALDVAQDPALVFKDLRGGMFSKVFGLLFWIAGPFRVVGQYTNALLGLSVVLLVMGVLDQLSLVVGRAVAVIALLPNSLVLSAIFLRESIIAFFIAVSLYYFVRWFRGGSTWNAIAVLAAVLIASTFHAGVVAVGLGYAITFLFYSRDAGRLGLGLGTLVYATLILAIVYFTLAQYPDVFLGKFESLETIEDLTTAANRRAGGSQYLSGLTVSTYQELMLYGPLRAVYFLGSPMPWSIRGLMDLFTVVVDSAFYLGVPAYFMMRRTELPKEQRVLGWTILGVYLVASLVFGAGVSNAGTAVRHRFKLVALAMLLLCVSTARPKMSGSKATESTSRLLIFDRRERSMLT